MAKTKKPAPGRIRHNIVLLFFTLAFLVIAGRASYLQVFSSDYLKREGKARYLRISQDNAVRGMIVDRMGTPLAISTPVDSIWAHPFTFNSTRKNFKKLASLLGMSAYELKKLAVKNSGREFMYLRRHVTPEVAQRIKAMEIPGVFQQREYRRYYPMGSVFGHVVGFTNIDDVGQEGLELSYEPLLQATPGRKRVIKDNRGKTIETVESISLPVSGSDLRVSLDRRIQYLAYRELKAAVKKHNAKSASAIVLDAASGEILAMVNEPGFNPNSRLERKSQLFRNRAVTDALEPGSTLKPFTIAAALESGRYTPGTWIDTAPGTYRVGSKTIHDTKDYGRLTVSGVIQKSSNVGATKIALDIGKSRLWDLLTNVGFGQYSGSALPGEARGIIRHPDDWVKMDHAAMSFGYGISVTPIQLARSYTALANGGDLVQLTMLPGQEPVVTKNVMSQRTAKQITGMLELAAGEHGTGNAAQVRYYRVAGKTGTVHKLVDGKYADNNYVALFAGVAPVSNPKLVMVVTVDDPSNGKHYGGQIAAPVFANVMAGTMRLLNIPPDSKTDSKKTIAKSRLHAGLGST